MRAQNLTLRKNHTFRSDTSYLTGFKMRNQIYKSIIEDFDKSSIEIPFPHTSVVFKNSIPG